MKLPLASTFLLLALAVSTYAETPTGNTEFERVRNTFGRLQTIAGRGDDEPANRNEWRSSMEGATATTVELSRPHMAMADIWGNVYVADKDGHGIRKVHLDGTITTIAGTTDPNTGFGAPGDDGDTGMGNQMRLNGPNGLYTFPDGTTFILDLGNGKIRRLATDGTMTTVITDPVSINPGRIGRGLWVSADESLIYYCAGNEVRKWTPSGGVEIHASGFSQLGNLDLDPQGNVVVTDRGTHRVSRINSDGSQTVIAGNGTTNNTTNGANALSVGLNEVRGIAFNPDGSYYLCTHRSSQVYYVDTAGIIWILINGDRNDGTHAGDGQRLNQNTGLQKISEPRSVTIAPNGDLLIAENDRGFIRRATNICIQPEIIASGFADTTPEFDLTFSSHREATYTLDTSTDLLTWTPTDTIQSSTGSMTTYRDSITGKSPPRLYYRVRENQ